MPKITKLTFDEVADIKIEPSERNHLDSLYRSRGWNTLQKLVEDYTLKLSRNIAVGTAVSKEARYDELDKMAGFVYYWRKIVNLIETPDEKQDKKQDEK